MMLVILCYDARQKKTARFRKTVLKYLKPVQRSVFEGELTEKSLNALKQDLSTMIDPESDAIVIYCLPNHQQVTRHQIGVSSDVRWII